MSKMPAAEQPAIKAWVNGYAVLAEALPPETTKREVLEQLSNNLPDADPYFRLLSRVEE